MTRHTQKNNIWMLMQLVIVVPAFLSAAFSCSKANSSKDAPAPATRPSTEPESNGTGQVEAPEATSLDGPCWDKVLDLPEARTCTGLFVYSSKTCVAGFTKEATCSKESILAKYGNATIAGQPIAAALDQWAQDGFSPQACVTGSDSKLYVYFLKKVYTPKVQSKDGLTDSYVVTDKKLGPSGAILNSIVVKEGGSLPAVSCH
jgi:hypothetical protein